MLLFYWGRKETKMTINKSVTLSRNEVEEMLMDYLNKKLQLKERIVNLGMDSGKSDDLNFVQFRWEDRIGL